MGAAECRCICSSQSLRTLSLSCTTESLLHLQVAQDLRMQAPCTTPAMVCNNTAQHLTVITNGQQCLYNWHSLQNCDNYFAPAVFALEDFGGRQNTFALNTN